MPGHKNVLSMSGMLEHLHDAAGKAKSNIENVQAMAEEKMYNIRYVDLNIQVSNEASQCRYAPNKIWIVYWSFRIAKDGVSICLG